MAIVSEIDLQSVVRWDGVRRQVKDVIGQIHGPGLRIGAVGKAIALALAHISTLGYAVLVAGVKTIEICRDIPILDLGLDGVVFDQEDVLHPTGSGTLRVVAVKLQAEPSVWGCSTTPGRCHCCHHVLGNVQRHPQSLYALAVPIVENDVVAAG
jgi:hypothetical protein